MKEQVVGLERRQIWGARGGGGVEEEGRRWGRGRGAGVGEIGILAPDWLKVWATHEYYDRNWYLRGCLVVVWKRVRVIKCGVTQGLIT